MRVAHADALLSIIQSKFPAPVQLRSICGAGVKHIDSQLKPFELEELSQEQHSSVHGNDEEYFLIESYHN